MKRVFINLFLGMLVFALIGCGYGGVESADVNSIENTNATENVNENVNEAEEEKIEEEEVNIEEITSAETALNLGNEFFERSQNDKAISAYKKAAKLDPDLAEAHFKLGISYAIKESQEELVAAPTDQPSPSENSKKSKEPKKTNSEIAFENAVTAYKKLVREDKKNADAFFNLGRAYNKLNDDKEARKALETAVKLEPDDSQFQTEYGAILIKFAKYDLAIRALEKAIKIDEANSQAVELLEQAKAGKKRVDFGAEKLKEKAAQE